MGASVYEYVMTHDFTAYRRNIAYMKCQPAPIQPLIPQLSFIPEPKRWGYPFRLGHVEMSAADFRLIAAAMEARLDD